MSDIVFAGPTIIEAPQSTFSSQKDIVINAPVSAEGNTTFAANNNIYVNANVTNDSGNLSFLADADLNGQGAFIQAPGTTIATTTWGNITIQGSGQNYLANIKSIGDIILKQGGAPAVFNEQPDPQYLASPPALSFQQTNLQNNAFSIMSTLGSITISQGVTLNANNAQYEVGGNWINCGTFNPQISTVTLTSSNEADIIGDNAFYNLYVEAPGKTIKFDTIAPIDVLNSLALVGGYGNLLSLESLNPGEQWSFQHQQILILNMLLLETLSVSVTFR